MTATPPTTTPSTRWTHVRAALLLFHVIGVVLLSLPNPAAFTRESSWRRANVQREIASWAGQLQRLGVDTDPARFEHDLRDITARYAAVQSTLLGPFSAYATLSGSRQGWQMFASPQRHPAEVHVDLWRDGAWQPLYRPHSEHTWNESEFLHNRLRKFQGRFARGFIVRHYDHFAEWIARRVAQDFPHAARVRVRLFRYTLPDPATAREVNDPLRPRYQHERVFDLDPWR